MKENKRPKKETLSKQPQDHIRSLALAAINAVPLAGGPIASLLADYLPNSLETRKERILLTLNDDVEKLKGQFNDEVLQREDFITIFVQCFRQMVINHQQEKLEAFRAIVLNTLIGNAPDDDKRMFFLGLTERLTPLHIKMLKILRDPVAAVQTNEAARQRFGYLSSGGLMELFGPLLREYEPELIKAAFKDLHTQDLHNTPEMNVTMTAHGIIAKRLTPLGESYAQFITLPASIEQ